ncbi:MAG TPA: hypothetical protein PKI14_04430 [Fervidobacterium sp.]|nr:hypothetical protein [Fervidobacterium sp.]
MKILKALENLNVNTPTSPKMLKRTAAINPMLHTKIFWYLNRHLSTSYIKGDFKKQLQADPCGQVLHVVQDRLKRDLYEFEKK